MQKLARTISKMKLCAVATLSVLSTSAGLFADAQTPQADAELLDALVRRGVLTEDESVNIRKTSATVRPSVIQTTPSEVSLYFYAQFRFSSISQSYSSPTRSGSSVSEGTSLRRQVVAFIVHLENGIELLTSINTAASNYFDSTKVSKKFETKYFSGTAKAGFSSPNFTTEDPRGAKIKTPDRSVVNTFWGGKDPGYEDDGSRQTANQCFAGNHVGVFWDGNFICDERIIYSFAVTSARNQHYNGLQDKIGLAYWASISVKIKEDKLSLRSGLNFGYSENTSSISYGLGAGREHCPTYGAVAYIIMQREDFFLHSETVITTTEHGKTRSDDAAIYTLQSPQATPFGFMLMLGRTFSLGQFGSIEPIFRYSYVYTDGAGVSESNVFYAAKSPNGCYNEINAYYIGANWYCWDGIKVQVGYENLRFSDAPLTRTHKVGKIDCGIIQFQVEF